MRPRIRSDVSRLNAQSAASIARTISASDRARSEPRCGNRSGRRVTIVHGRGDLFEKSKSRVAWVESRSESRAARSACSFTAAAMSREKTASAPTGDEEPPAPRSPLQGQPRPLTVRPVSRAFHQTQCRDKRPSATRPHPAIVPNVATVMQANRTSARPVVALTSFLRSEVASSASLVGEDSIQETGSVMVVWRKRSL